MRRVLCVAVLALANRAAAQPPAPERLLPPELVVSGRSEIRVLPDRAFLELAVETRAGDAAEAGEENARRMRGVLEALQRIGFTQPAVTTTGYAVRPAWRHDGAGKPPKQSGYEARNGVRVRVEELGRLGALIDAALAGGATRVGTIRYTVSTESELQLDALAAAVTQAQARAQAMATAAGGTLGPLIQLTTERYESPPGIQGALMLQRAEFSESRSETPITPGELTVAVTVLARWQFTPPR